MLEHDVDIKFRTRTASKPPNAALSTQGAYKPNESEPPPPPGMPGWFCDRSLVAQAPQQPREYLDVSGGTHAVSEANDLDTTHWRQS
jgi:hypothetical protein